MEEVKIINSNIVSCEIVSGYHRWSLIGMYLPPGNQCKDLKTCHEQLDKIEMFINGKSNPIIIGDFNFRPGETQKEIY